MWTFHITRLRRVWKIDRINQRISNSHLTDMISSIGILFIPIFFVYTGLQIDVRTLLNPHLYLMAIIISVVAILTKFISGFVIQGTIHEKMLVGISMIPRGEVGLIFAAAGREQGVLTGELYSTVLLVIIITTFLSPPLINFFLNKFPIK